MFNVPTMLPGVAEEPILSWPFASATNPETGLVIVYAPENVLVQLSVVMLVALGIVRIV